MKKAPLQERNSRRGLSAILILLGCAALAGGSALAMSPSRHPAAGLLVSAATDPMKDAKAAFVDGDWATAEKILRTLPGDEARTLLGRVLLEKGHAEEASALFGEILKSSPKNFDAVRGLAMAQESMGRTDLASMYWRRAAELRPKDAKVWRDLALCQHRGGDAMGALASLRQAIQLDPQLSELTGLLSELASGKTPGAVPATDQSGLLSPAPGMPRPLSPASLMNGPHVGNPLENGQRSRGLIQ